MIGIGIGVGLTTGAATSELSQIIAMLRSVGGSLYLPGLTSRVAADGSGYVPVAGDVIGFLPDRVTGLTANAATQATTAVKPKLIDESIGYTERYSLKFDGVDDVLVGTAGPTLSDGLVMVWAGKMLASDATFRRLVCAEADTINSVSLSCPNNSVTFGAIKGGTNISANVQVAAAIGETVVVSAILTATSYKIRKNGGAWVTSTHSTPLGDVVLAKFGIGARPIAASNFSNQSLSATMVANLGANATDANIAILERAAAQAAGITL